MRIDGLFNTQQGAALKGLTDILSRVNVGDVIKAQLIEASANEVLLKLFDGTSVKAALTAPLDAKAGDIIDFTVKGKNSSNQLILETVKQQVPNTSNDSQLGKLLSAEGIEPVQTNLDIAKELNSNNLPVTKEVFNKVLDLMSKFNSMDITPEKAVFMVKNSIAPTSENIQSLNRLVDERFKVTDSIRNLVETLSDINDESLKETIKNNLTKIDAKYDSAPREIQVKTNQTADSKVLMPKQDQQAPEDQAKNILSKITSKLSPEVASAAEKLIDETGVQEKLVQLIKNQNTPSGETEAKAEDFIMSELEKNSEKLPSDLKNISGAILKVLHEIKNEGTANNAQAKENDFKNLLHKVFSKTMLDVENGDLKNQGAVKNSYKELFEKLESVKQDILNSSLPVKDQLMDKIDNLQNNTRFLNEIANYSTYIQLPVNVKGNETTAQLYVLKRDPGRKRLDPENLTVYLSLDTQNIGQVDSLINISKKSILLNFRLEDKKFSGIFKEGYNELYESLKEKDYKLVGMNFGNIDTGLNPVNAHKKFTQELKSSRGSIDFKI
ncbi:MAG: hypothetical protein Q8920_09975 [Bacillota bacterium]|nr:hypothetical protein [Bacillota bacterium]